MCVFPNIYAVFSLVERDVIGGRRRPALRIELRNCTGKQNLASAQARLT